MIKGFFIVIGVIVTLISKGLLWETIGLTTVILTLMIPKRKKRFTKIKTR